ncbi:MAG: hypothetical protein RL199_1234, partial [Pseudomonadota bacterium]
AVVLVDGVEVGRSESVSDSVKPVWNYSVPVTIAPTTATFGIQIFNKDLLSDSLIDELVCTGDCIEKTFRQTRLTGQLTPGSLVKLTYTIGRQASP